VESEERWLSAVELEELLSVLNPKICTLFLLHHLFGYSYADLAAINKMNVLKRFKKPLSGRERKCSRLDRSEISQFQVTKFVLDFLTYYSKFIPKFRLLSYQPQGSQ